MPRVAEAAAATLGLRVVSGAVLGLAAVGATVAGGLAFAAFAAVAGLIIATEWERLQGGSGVGRGALIHLATVAAAIAFAGTEQFGWAVLAIAAGGLATLAPGSRPTRQSALYSSGVVYTTLALVALLWLRGLPEAGLGMVLWLLAVIWSTDIGAFFVGRAIGGPKLAPAISPGKTWAGAFGGTAAAGISGGAAGLVFVGASLSALVAASVIVSLVGQAGDLMISTLKRNAGVKDTGRIIPGHGGVLDRLDSLLPAAIVVAAAATLLQQQGVAWP